MWLLAEEKTFIHIVKVALSEDKLNDISKVRQQMCEMQVYANPEMLC